MTQTTADARRRFLRALSLLLATAPLAACSGLLASDRPPPRLFRLTPKNTFDADLPRVPWQLILEPPVADASIDTMRIALLSSAHELKHYADVSWTDRAPLMIQTLLVESFENSQRITAVGRESLGLRADYVLKSELREFQAEYLQEGPPLARVAIAVRLVRNPRREIVGVTEVEAHHQAASDEVSAIVAAFDEALGKVLKQLVSWTIRKGQEFYRPQG